MTTSAEQPCATRGEAWKSYPWHHEPDLSELPARAWPLRSRCRVLRVSNVGPLDGEAQPPVVLGEARAGERVVRVVCMSDTHRKAAAWLERGAVPDGDVFLFAGDMTGKGSAADVRAFAEFVAQLPHAHKVVVAGNHDVSLDREFYEHAWAHFHEAREDEAAAAALAELRAHCTFLDDECCDAAGLRVFGSPRSPDFGRWAFPVFPDDPRRWDHAIHRACGDRAPDVVLCHGPPPGHGSVCACGVDAGDAFLLDTLQHRFVPALVVAGHIHEGYGVTRTDDTVFVNASSMDRHYCPANRCIVVDLAIPPPDCDCGSGGGGSSATNSTAQP